MNAALLNLIRKVHYLTNCVVPYKPRETECPVCKLISTVDRNSVKVLKTVEGIRYCECLKCGSHFRAFKEPAKKAKLEKVQKICTDKKESVKNELKAGKKANGNQLTGSRTRSGKQCHRGNTKRSSVVSDK